MSKRLSIEKSQFIKFSDLSLNHVYNSPISYQTQTKSVDASIEKTKSIICISNNLILRMSPKGRKNSQYTQYILVDTRIGFISIKRVYRRVKCVVALTELHQNTNETLHNTPCACYNGVLCQSDTVQFKLWFQRNHVFCKVCCANNDLLASCDRENGVFYKSCCDSIRLLCRCVTIFWLPDCNAGIRSLI